MATNLTYKLNKLQFALKQGGYVITMSTTQFYLPREKRFIKVYHIKHNTKEIYKSSSKIKIIKFLAELYKIVKNADKKDNLNKYVLDKMKDIEVVR